MSNIPYVDYSKLDEFYTIRQLTDLLGVSKQELKKKCEQFGIKPRQNEIGDYGFVRYDVRKLHNKLYHECRNNSKSDAWEADDPWA